MNSIENFQLREATAADIAGMARCQLDDPVNPLADSRMGAYFAGLHHPQQALLARVGYVALINEQIVGYIAGHLTTRHGCAGELQYLFVSPHYRRRGIGTALFRGLAKWFQAQAAKHVCVALADDSPKEAKPFYESTGASPLKKYWYAWKDVGGQGPASRR
jgi:GNAT superfamily N-acetyltransferase